MKSRIIFLILSLTIIFGTVLFVSSADVITVNGIPFFRNSIAVPQGVFNELGFTFDMNSTRDSIKASKLPDDTTFFELATLDYSIFAINNDEVTLYTMPVLGQREIKSSPKYHLLLMSERAEYADISHYLVAMSRNFYDFSDYDLIAFDISVPDADQADIEKAINELSEIIGIEVTKGAFEDFITESGMNWAFKKEYGSMAHVTITQKDRLYGNMSIAVFTAYRNGYHVNQTYLVEKIDEKLIVTRTI